MHGWKLSLSCVRNAQPGKNDDSRNALCSSVSSIVCARKGTSDGTHQRVAQFVSPLSINIAHIVPSVGAAAEADITLETVW